mmetsp:Transcript_35567/g.102244  ORF Transcript_35567/g.102244 Transcript_35567/m.102244 type:complete len:214 (-) Transcript_35567:1125-1766(-)
MASSRSRSTSGSTSPRPPLPSSSSSGSVSCQGIHMPSSSSSSARWFASSTCTLAALEAATFSRASLCNLLCFPASSSSKMRALASTERQFLTFGSNFSRAPCLAKKASMSASSPVLWRRTFLMAAAVTNLAMLNSFFPHVVAKMPPGMPPRAVRPACLRYSVASRGQSRSTIQLRRRPAQSMPREKRSVQSRIFFFMRSSATFSSLKSSMILK